MKVIALTGRAGSGKDTAAAFIQLMTATRTAIVPISIEEFVQDYAVMPFSTWNPTGPCSEHFHVHKFAWPVYQIAGIILGRNPDDLMLDRNFKTSIQYKGLTGRQLLQKIGTECFRDVLGTSVWCDIMDSTLSKERSRDTPGVIISDLRFINEDVFLDEKHEAIIIKLVGRDNGTPTDHPSEAQIDSIKPAYTVHNDGDYKDLAMQLETICQRLKILNAKYTWK
jgi:hypothetical protein